MEMRNREGIYHLSYQISFFFEKKKKKFFDGVRVGWEKGIPDARGEGKKRTWKREKKNVRNNTSYSYYICLD